MVSIGQKAPQATEIWRELLALHQEMKLGDKITHPMRERLNIITKKQFVLVDDLTKLRTYEKIG